MTKKSERQFPEVLTVELNNLSPAELQIARALIDSNYLSGTENASRLAQLAGVSSPTVARFAERLGFDNYNNMRQAIIRHYSDRLKGPSDLLQSETEAQIREGTTASVEKIKYQEIVTDCLKDTNLLVMQQMGKKLAKPSVSVFSTGGSFSTVVARHFYMHLNSLRKNCIFVDARTDRQNKLVDLKPGSFGVIFDFRRYQTDTLEFARSFKSRGGRIFLITDPFISPISELAEAIVTVKSEIAPPFDSSSGAIVVAEYIVQQVYVNLGEQARNRLKSMDALRSELR